MGVQDGCESRCSPELFIVFREGLQHILYCCKHQGIDDSLVLPGKLPELAWKGDGYKEVSTGQQFAKLLVNPLLTLMVLTMGAVSVAAGMWDISQLPTLLL